VVAYALYNLGCSQSCKDHQLSLRDFIREKLDDKQVEVGQALTREMMQGKPTQVISRYLKTGAVEK
jgi:hypothetical protein